MVSWLNRGTLHLVGSDDYWWLHQLTTPPLVTGNARRLHQEGVSPQAAERGVAIVARELAEHGPLTRQQLGERIRSAGVPTAGQALVHILVLATLRGLTVRGPAVGLDQAYVLVDDWLGPRPRVDRDTSLAELTRRYLAGHGPASDRDLAKWAGLPLRDARRGLSLVADSLVSLGDLVALRGKGEDQGLGTPRLLGAYDPLLHGWQSRADILGDADGVITVNGLFRPFALVDGRAVATWSLGSGRLAVRPFTRLAPDVRAQLKADAVDVGRFLGNRSFPVGGLPERQGGRERSPVMIRPR